MRTYLLILLMAAPGVVALEVGCDEPCPPAGAEEPNTFGTLRLARVPEATIGTPLRDGVSTESGIAALDLDRNQRPALLIGDGEGPSLVIRDPLGDARATDIDAPVLAREARALDVDGDGEIDIVAPTRAGAAVLFADGERFIAVDLLPAIESGEAGVACSFGVSDSGCRTAEICTRELHAVVVADRDDDGDVDILVLGGAAWLAEQTAPRKFAAHRVLDVMPVDDDQYVVVQALVLPDAIVAVARLSVGGNDFDPSAIFALTTTGPVEILAARGNSADIGARVLLTSTLDGTRAVTCVGSELREIDAALTDGALVLDACAYVLADVDGDGSPDAFGADQAEQVISKTDGTAIGETLATIEFSSDPIAADLDGDARAEVIMMTDTDSGSGGD